MMSFLKQSELSSSTETESLITQRSTIIHRVQPNSYETEGLSQVKNELNENYEYLELRTYRPSNSEEEDKSEINSSDEQVLTANIRTNQYIVREIIPNAVLAKNAVFGFSNLHKNVVSEKCQPSKFLNKMRLTKIQANFSNLGDPNALARIEAFNCERVKLYSSLICACGYVSSIYAKDEHKAACDFLKKNKR